MNGKATVSAAETVGELFSVGEPGEVSPVDRRLAVLVGDVAALWTAGLIVATINVKFKENVTVGGLPPCPLAGPAPGSDRTGGAEGEPGLL
jgi:hypothetical protein